MDKSEIIERLERIAEHAVHTVGGRPFVMSLDDGIAVHEAIELLTNCPEIPDSCNAETVESFKYEEDRVFIVASDGEAYITAYGAKRGEDLETEITLKPGELYRAFCCNGKFHVFNDHVKLVLTAEQLDFYFKEPFIGVMKDSEEEAEDGQ